MTTHSPADRPAKRAAKSSPPHAKTAPRRWSKRVTETSDALDLQQDVFKLADPRRIAQSLKRSAERSERRKIAPFRSAMSMLSFYINRAGANLDAEQRRHLEDAKDELRELFGRPVAGKARTGSARR
jgi:hypothetical protein